PRHSGGQWSGKSPRPSPRPPAGQRAGTPDPGAQQLDLHAELADALHGGGQFAACGVAFALLQRAIQGGVRLLPPLLELVDRHAKLQRWPGANGPIVGAPRATQGESVDSVDGLRPPSLTTGAEATSARSISRFMAFITPVSSLTNSCPEKPGAAHRLAARGPTRPSRQGRES